MPFVKDNTKPTKMNKLKRQALLQEFEIYLLKQGKYFRREVMFNELMETDRKFRADYIIHGRNTIIEINGGQYVNGRHNRGGRGYMNDLTKSNIANYFGWRYLQFTYEQLEKAEYKEYL